MNTFTSKNIAKVKDHFLSKALMKNMQSPFPVNFPKVGLFLPHSSCIKVKTLV